MSARSIAAPSLDGSGPATALPGAAAVLEKRHAENFPVALRLLPRAERGHLLALYGYARLVDDVGDEMPGDRDALLDVVERDLDRVFAGERPSHPLLRRLVPTVADCALSEEPFRRLLEANRQDQHTPRYASYADLRAYCTLSAEPVGRLVLEVFGMATPDRVAGSDAICAALQLAEHWQDLAEDWGRGRVYLPQEDLARFGVAETALGEARASAGLRRLLAFEVDRTRNLLCRGEGLVGSLRGPARRAVAGFAAGGHAALDAVERRDYDVLAAAPRTRRRDVLRHGLALWRRGQSR